MVVDTRIDWARNEMVGARITHGKERTSLIKAVRRLGDHPQMSFSGALGNDVRQATHRIFEKPEITTQNLMEGHVQATIERIRELAPDLLLVACDTVEFDFSTHRSAKDLGPINDRGWGIFAHDGMAITEAGVPLGMLHLDLWSRDPQAAGSRKQKREKPYVQKESFKWAKAIASVEECLPPEQAVLLIQDREADIFAFIAQLRRPNTHLLIRACEPRRVEIEPGKVATIEGEMPPRTLFDAIAQVPSCGTYSFTVGRRADQSPREATLEVRFCPMTLPAPGKGHKDDPKEPQPIWLVQVREMDVPSGITAVEWTLLSTLPVTTFDEARAMVVRYSYRWLIERLHYTLKSGCGAEQLQLDDFASLSKALTLYYIVAWRLLYLAYQARVFGDTPAQSVLSQEELMVLTQASNGKVSTIAEAILAIAKMGGYTCYRNAPPPGVKTLWIGLRKLENMVEGFQLAIKALKLMNQA